VSSLSEIKRLDGKEGRSLWEQEYIPPVVKLSPREAFYAEREILPLASSRERVSSEFVMCYTPCIPLLAPGELITRDVIDHILYAKEKGSLLMGPQDMTLENIFVVKREV
jgi:lysine decarboxylase